MMKAKQQVIEDMAIALHHAEQQEGAQPCLYKSLGKYSKRMFTDAATAAYEASGIDELQETITNLTGVVKSQKQTADALIKKNTEMVDGLKQAIKRVEGE